MRGTFSLHERGITMTATQRRLKQSEYLAELQTIHGSVDALAARAARDPSLRPLVDEWQWLAAHPERDEELIVVVHEAIVRNGP